jgi:cysteine-rich repeat protein
MESVFVGREAARRASASTDRPKDGRTRVRWGTFVYASGCLVLLAMGSGCGGSCASGADGEDRADIPDPDGDLGDRPAEADGSADEDGEGGSEGAGDGPVPPPDLSCGNGTVDPGEECDDGNRLNGDGCDWRCMIGDGASPPDLPPDPDAGHAEGDLPPTAVELGVESPSLAAVTSPGNRLPLASDGTNYATVWPHWAGTGSERRVEGTFVRFDAAGRRLDAPWTYRLAPDSGDAYLVPRADLAWNGAGYGLLWSGRAVVPPGEGPGLSFLALDVDGKPLGEPVELASSSGFAERLGIAWDGEGFGVVADMVAGPRDLSLMRIERGGTSRTGARSLYSGAPGRATGALAASAALYVTAWTDWGRGNEVRYAVAAGDGLPLGSAVMGFESIATPPDVAWSGEEFGMAWIGVEPGASRSCLILARLSDRGELRAPPRCVLEEPEAGFAEEFALAFGNETYAAAWFNYAGTNLVRMDRNGTFVEHVVFPYSDVEVVTYGAVGIAADQDGFGVLGMLSLPGMGSNPGPPVFIHFRIVR